MLAGGGDGAYFFANILFQSSYIDELRLVVPFAKKIIHIFFVKRPHLHYFSQNPGQLDKIIKIFL